MDEQQSVSRRGSSPDQGEAALRALALRLLAPRYPGMPAPGEIQLLTGRLPDPLPVEIPIPDGATVAGSLVRGVQGIEIVLDTHLSPDQIRDFYQARMVAAGWNIPSPGFPGERWGFTPGAAVHSMLFCRGTRGPALQITTFTVPGVPNDVRLHLITDARHSPCMHRGGPPSFEATIPQLAPPPGAEQWPGAGGGGGDSWLTTARLTTDLELPAIVAHYAAQLEQAGWARTGEDQSGPQAWST